MITRMHGPTRRAGSVASIRNIKNAMRGKEPNPYFAILRADGDRIGARLGEIRSAEEHREFSALLRTFAIRAKEIVATNDGHLVYAGGDDVLAFLPLHTCLRCAADLSAAFRTTGCTLSVGVAIVHYHEPLHMSLESARQAEHAAKEDGGNCLHVTVRTRGGEARHASLTWDGTAGLDPWREWVKAFQDGQAAGFPYEVDRLARELKGAALPPEVIRGEVTRIFARKKGWKGAGEAAGIERLLYHVNDHAALHRLAQELIVFRWLASQCKTWRWEDGQ